MSKGIALSFKNKFGRVEDLKSLNISSGGCLYLKQDERYIL